LCLVLGCSPRLDPLKQEPTGARREPRRRNPRAFKPGRTSRWAYDRTEAVDPSSPEVEETIKAAAAEEGKPVSAWLAEAATEKARAAALQATGRAAAV
jgi:hypothetical protein